VMAMNEFTKINLDRHVNRSRLGRHSINGVQREVLLMLRAATGTLISPDAGAPVLPGGSLFNHAPLPRCQTVPLRRHWRKRCDSRFVQVGNRRRPHGGFLKWSGGTFAKMRNVRRVLYYRGASAGSKVGPERSAMQPAAPRGGENR
jgi:hypothetical protein